MSARRPSAKMRLLVLAGTRPEAVKMAPIVEAARRAPDVDVRVVSSGQHPRAMLDAFDEYGIEPDADLEAFEPGQSLTSLLGRVLAGFAEQIEAWEPDVVLVQGDTTSALAGALAAFYARVPVGHVEAGLRTNNLLQPYPEEMNRRAIDTFADYLFPPTPAAARNVEAERERGAQIFVTGNTVVDAAVRVAATKRALQTSPEIDHAWNNGYRRKILVTVHRRESWGADLDAVAAGLAQAARRFPNDLFVVPLHPNPVVRRSFATELPGNVLTGEPLNYGSFIRMLSGANLVVTDSGGILEEATSFGKHVLVVRKETERAEAIRSGAATIVGVDANTIDAAITSVLGNPERAARTLDVFGDGHAGHRTVAWLRWRLGLAVTEPAAFVPAEDAVPAGDSDADAPGAQHVAAPDERLQTL
jgi:UDP-N-acetylglucosamine 2-epimerase (non-hydrolysing)